MMDFPQRDDSEWLERLNNPDTREQAAQYIFRRYSEQLLALVRQKLTESIQHRVEPQDILQSVWKSFFSKKCELLTADTLFPLLSEMSVRKTVSAARRHQARMRSVDAEVVLKSDAEASVRRPSALAKTLRFSGDLVNPKQSPVAAGNEDNDSSMDMDACQAMISGATPEQAANAIELFNRLPEELQQIMRLRLEGFTDEEIAAELRCARRTIVRRTALIRKTLLALCDA